MNYLAILVAALAGMAIGFCWYGPLFGKAWLKLSGITKEDIEKAQAKGMGKTYALTILATVVTGWILSLMIAQFNLSTVSALRLAFLVWLGFLVPSMANLVLWEGKNVKLFLINIAERLVTFLVMSGILSSWR